jgi:uncharacterized repeat protein (TIGR01451 family)
VRRWVRVGGAFVVTACAMSGWIPVAHAAGGPDVAATVTSDAVGTVLVGGSFSYTIGVENTGDQTARGVSLSDDLPTGVVPSGPPVLDFGDGSCTVASSQLPGGAPPHYSYFCEVSSLATGASASVTFAVRVTGDVRCGTVVNRVRAEATNEPAANADDDEAETSVEVACPPALTLSKSGPSYARVGQRVTFTYRAKNTGGVPIDDVSVADPGCDAAPARSASGGTTLDRGETWVFRCTATIRRSTPSPFTTTARAVGHATTGTAHASARAALRVIHPRLTLVVTAAPVSGTPGDTIVYRYVVHNVGDVTLTDVAITDDRLGAIGTIATLAAGRTATLHATRVLSDVGVWVTNVASARASDPTGASVEASDDASISLVAASQGSGGDPDGGTSDGTAFTGTDVTRPVAAMVGLALVGALLLGLVRRSA